MSNLTYLQGYPEHLLAQVRTLIAEQRLGEVLQKRYPDTHNITTDKALVCLDARSEKPVSAQCATGE